MLVVDDDPVVLELVRDRLEEAGYEVEVREVALGTTQYVADQNPDVVQGFTELAGRSRR